MAGQNVNSYRDTSSVDHYNLPSNGNVLSADFKTVYKPKMGGLRFSTLLEKVSSIDPEMRIRFTSPHPKDFPDEVGFKGLAVTSLLSRQILFNFYLHH